MAIFFYRVKIQTVIIQLYIINNMVLTIVQMAKYSVKF